MDSDTRREDKYEASPTETDESSVLVLCKNKTMSHFSEKVLSVQGRVVVTSDVHSCLEIMTQAVMQKVNAPSAWLLFFFVFFGVKCSLSSSLPSQQMIMSSHPRFHSTDAPEYASFTPFNIWLIQWIRD